MEPTEETCVGGQSHNRTDRNGMARYFFDVENGSLTVDDAGMTLEGPDAIAGAAMTTLLEIAKFEVVANNERELSVTVRDEAGKPVYRTSLTIRAGWLFGSP